MDKIEEFFRRCVVVDLETTNINPSTAEIVEIAYATYNEGWKIDTSLHMPTVPIPPEASAKNHISNRMVEGLPLFSKDHPFFSMLNSMNSPVYLVAHNAKYEETVFGNYEIGRIVKPNLKWICSYRIAKKIYNNLADKMQYNLSYLRYKLDLDISDDNIAHRAEADVEVTIELLKRLIEDGIRYEKIDDDSDIGEQLIQLDQEPIVSEEFPFGKHKGEKLRNIPTSYFIWALENMDVFREGDEKYNSDLLYSVGLELERRGEI